MMHRSFPSPDGKWLLGVEMDRYGWIPCRLVSLTGLPSRAAGPLPGRCTFAAWSPDGNWMYFSTDAGGSMQIWKQRFPDGPPEQLTFGPSVAEGIAVAPDGSSLITSIGMEQRSVWVSANGGDRQISPEGDAVFPVFGDGLPNSVFSLDRSKLYYLVQRGTGRAFGGGELWMADLSSGACERFLPGLHVASYDVSGDGKRIVVSVVDEQRQSRLWLVSTDRRSPPTLLPPPEAMGPVFGRHNNIFFRAPEGDKDFLFELSIDSGAIRKAVSDPAILAPTVSPDGEWIVSLVPLSESDHTTELRAYPRRQGTPVNVCPSCTVKWTRDAASLFVTFGAGNFMSEPKTFVIALTPGKMLPALPAGGLRSEKDLAQLPVVRVIPGLPTVFPGPTASTYAFGRASVQRNLYRVPLN